MSQNPCTLGDSLGVWVLRKVILGTITSKQSEYPGVLGFQSSLPLHRPVFLKSPGFSEMGVIAGHVNCVSSLSHFCSALLDLSPNPQELWKLFFFCEGGVISLGKGTLFFLWQA
jgi:hypothetical protein